MKERSAMRGVWVAIVLFTAQVGMVSGGSSDNDSIPSAPLVIANTKGQPLVQPGEAGVRDGDNYHITLLYSTARFVGPFFDSYIRIYNGTSPAPTWRLRQGDNVTLTIINDLLPQPYANTENNEFRMPNSTNTHTHGIHGSGMNPGDNIFVDIEPGQNHTYHYSIDSNHMPGTHWYHPHWHGSTTLQTGQGAAGAIIIEDPDDYLPREISEMPEIVMIFLHLGFGTDPDDQTDIQRAAEQSNSTLQSSAPVVTNATISDATNVVLINGQFQPVLSMDQNKWYRWRIVHTSSLNSLILAPEGEDCDLRLLAKDGIYLHHLGREVPKIVLAPGNRADLAVRCRSAGSFQLLTNSTTDQADYALANYSAPFSRISTVNGNDARILATLNVSAASADGEPGIRDLLKDFVQQPVRPCYLVDLTGDAASDSVDSTFTVDLDGKFGPKLFNNQSWMNDTVHVNEYRLGTVQDIVLPGTGHHPYHQHIKPYQIIEVTGVGEGADATAGGWYLPGDWQDTFMHPLPTANATIRFQVDRFTGNMIAHCHILSHEDEGMMAQYLLTGTPGDWWAKAREIDPTCTLPSNPAPQIASSSHRRLLDTGRSRAHRKLAAFAS